MSPVPAFHLRSESALGQPTNTSGSPRPLLPLNLPWLTYHYSGVAIHDVFASDGDGIFDTDAEVAAYIRRVEQVARGSGKPYEYNAIIPAMADPNAANVWAYADEFQAAHSAGENAQAYGVQFPNGIGQTLTAGQINAFTWWHGVLVAAGRLAVIHQVLPHHDMPGANTQCPGPAIDGVRSQLLAAWRPDTPEVQHMDTPKLGGIIAIYQPTFTQPDYDPAWFVVYAEGHIRRAGEADVKLANLAGIPVVEYTSPDHYDQLHEDSGTAYPARPGSHYAR